MTFSPSITPRQSVSGSSHSPEKVSLSNNFNGDATSDRKDSAPGLGLPTALKPIGIVNEQNTCFLNSTFQALSATGPLISLLNSSPSGPLVPAPLSVLPPTVFPSSRIPALLPEATEPPLYPLLPVTKTFIASLQKAWKMKDSGGGTSGSGETSSSRSMRLHHLLREMARKYDQYDDYMQQDAHELLRHLLDSMEMEEKDVIKRVQPPLPGDNKKKKKYRDGISPLPSAAPSPAPSAPASPTKTTFVTSLAPENHEDPSRSSSIDSLGAGGGAIPREIPEDERLVPFVDVLFGGLLASVVVCEHCKSVSHTYEGFLDISLSLKGDEPRMRKRDKLKAAFGLKSKPPVRKGSLSDAPSSSSIHSSVMSESELSDSETRVHLQAEQNRRRSIDHDDRPSADEHGMKRHSSVTSKFGLKAKSGFGFRRKGSQPSSSSSSAVDLDKTPPAVSIPGSPNTFMRHHGPGPTPAQSAYIKRILTAPSNSHQVEDPLAKLRAANAGEGTAVNEKTVTLTGLEESLKAFTSVEVLEGDNAFACRKCWKVKTGKYQNNHATVPEEDEGGEPEAAKHSLPSISVVGSDAASETSFAAQDDRLLGRVPSSASRSSSGSHSQLTPSPLRQHLESNTDLQAGPAYADSMISADTAHTVDPEGELSDGLSNSSSDDEPPPADIPIGMRPKMPTRRKSSHFVMRRAFKRYLIAQPPEVLVFHFKRFKQMHKSGLTFTSFYDLKKMDDFVSFPETFDLAPYLAPNRNDYKATPSPHGMHAPYMDWPSPEHGPEHQTPVMYRLYALVVHLGSMIGGHYIAYVLVDPEVMFNSSTVPSGVEGEVTNGIKDISISEAERESRPNNLPKKDRRVWCYCSDTTVRLASVDEVLAAKAYICFLSCTLADSLFTPLFLARSLIVSFFNPFRRAQAENASGQITVQVKWGRDRFNIPIPQPNLTPLSTLLATLSAQTNIPISQLKLIYKGAVLKDQSLTISSYGITDGSTLVLIGKEGEVPQSNNGNTNAASPAPAPTANAPGPIRGKMKQPDTDSEQVLTDWIKNLVKNTLEPLQASIVTFISYTSPKATNRPAQIPAFEVLQKEHARLSEILLRGLLDLDNVEIQSGWQEARKERKEGVKRIQNELTKVDEAWGERKKLGG